MSYRKFKADRLFTGKQMLDESHVLITDEHGIIKDVVHANDAGDDVQIFEGLISPGFVNCHCHLELSHMKNVIGQRTGLVDFLIKVVSLRASAKEDIEAAMHAADEEMFNNGIVATGDICNTAASIKIKLESRIRYHNFVEVLGFTEENVKQRLVPYLAVYNEFCDAGFTAHTTIVPHAPYTISKTMFRLINDLSVAKIVSIHNQESLAEDELYRNKSGDFFKLYRHLNIDTDFFQPDHTSSVQAYLPLLDAAKKLILVHNTCTTQADINFVIEQMATREQSLYWCLCPNANLYIEDRLPPVELFMQNNQIIVLGTDSYSNNNSLNILDEIKTLQKNFKFIALNELLQWATTNGAKALDMDDKLGSFEKGKQPGVILITHLVNKNISEASTVIRLS